jgi:hypothetical protein
MAEEAVTPGQDSVADEVTEPEAATQETPEDVEAPVLAEEPATVAAAESVGEESEPVLPVADAAEDVVEQAPEESVPDETLASGEAGEPKVTLADVDREAVEEGAETQQPDWSVDRLRELVGVLANMAGEATQQERNARTLTFKLRAMLQGMPNTRRVDMMAAWLRAALEAVTQSATQVQQQASKTIPASAFQPAKKASSVED